MEEILQNESKSCYHGILDKFDYNTYRADQLYELCFEDNCLHCLKNNCFTKSSMNQFCFRKVSPSYPQNTFDTTYVSVLILSINLAIESRKALSELNQSLPAFK